MNRPLSLHVLSSEKPPQDTAMLDTTEAVKTYRGFAFGIILSVPIWAMLGWLVWALI